MFLEFQVHSSIGSGSTSVVVVGILVVVVDTFAVGILVVVVDTFVALVDTLEGA